MAGTLQVLTGSTWGTASGSYGWRDKPSVRFWRLKNVTANEVSAAIETVGARIVYAYMGTLNAGTVTAGNVDLLVNPDISGISAAPDYVTTTAAGGRYLQGTIHGTTENSNVVAIYRDPPASIFVGVSGLTGSTPDCDIIIEVHY